MADEELDDSVRQMASIIFKNFIINRGKVSKRKHAQYLGLGY